MEPASSTPGGTRGSPRTAAGFVADQGAAEIEVVVAAPAWRRVVPRAEALARRAARAALAGEGAGAVGMVTVLLADDHALRRLNAQHRGKDKPTNVLSFPGEAPGHAGPGGRRPRHLGDVALALGVVRREAAAAGRRPGAHLAHLVAHGTLHLLGHDHLTAGEARRMERAEARAMARLRLPNPWKRVAA